MPPVDPFHIWMTVHQRKSPPANLVHGILHDAGMGVAAGKALLNNGNIVLPNHVDRDLEMGIVCPSVPARGTERPLSNHIRSVLEAFTVHEVQNRFVVSKPRTGKPPGLPVSVPECREASTAKSFQAVSAEFIQGILPSGVVGPTVQSQFVSFLAKPIEGGTIRPSELGVVQRCLDHTTPAQLGGRGQLVRAGWARASGRSRARIVPSERASVYRQLKLRPMLTKNVNRTPRRSPSFSSAGTPRSRQVTESTSKRSANTPRLRPFPGLTTSSPTVHKVQHCSE